ncbi:MAG TPA: DoxX family protein [Bacteroidales bacterium]|nr:DoxX family protein [Bacteroidales bacterium]
MRTNIFAIDNNTVAQDVALLLFRVVSGSAFAFYGWGKIQHPLNWMGDEAIFTGFFQALAAIAEFCGGIAWILGFLTRLGAFGIGCTMGVAVYMHLIVIGDPFVSFTGGGSYDHALIFLVIALLLLVMGPGRFSLDRLVFGKN